MKKLPQEVRDKFVKWGKEGWKKSGRNPKNKKPKNDKNLSTAPIQPHKT